MSIIIIGTPDWAQNNVPRFTCINQSEQHIGELAGEILLENILGETDAETWQQEKIPCEFCLEIQLKN